MQELNNEELLAISGGSVAINASLLSAIVKGATISFEMGRSLGSSIRKAVDRKFVAI